MWSSFQGQLYLGGIGVGLILLALVLACGVDENCRPTWQDANGMIKKLGSDGINTIQWTAEKLNQAFAKYPLLPENSPSLQVFAGLALSVTGLDTLTDFAALVSGRDPLTGRALTPRDMFITWLALSIPFVAASALHGFADDAAMLFKTGIWGGTIDDIAAALPPDVAMGVRPRPVAAGLWELTRLTSPKPVKSAAEELMKLKWGSIDTGLRLMKDRTGQRSFKLFLAHSDIG